ncbi:hypothetical protein [Winogradskyella luteola]|uniref:Uncharacterized protein n=1 Tax=Winogradskyella luteola TaxID=2828330 RepID=A0A9X1F8M2_9FLAO|nr:hypothetical protein [Winogradskyella luteola]MBV7267980.1 hypothetical protein [Winogradskyella luteola]
MKKRILVIITMSVFFVSFVNAQKIKIKKNTVYVDGKECLKISGDSNNVSFSDMSGNELFFLKFIHNSPYVSLYTKVTFFEEDMSFTSSSYVFTKKLLIKKLVSDGTLKDCKLISEKLKRFVQKYDENVEMN